MSTLATVAPALPAPHWHGELELRFDRHHAGSRQTTRLARRRHLGPFVVQRPFHPEVDGTCHVYLLHPPGGVAGGDTLHLACHLESGARCVLTTPGATKYYRSDGSAGVQRNVFDLGCDAVCEYLPQETIVFDGARARIETRAMLDETASFTGWDFLCLGRPAAGELFRRGEVVQQTEILRAGRRLWHERLHLPGGSPLLHAAYGLAGRTVVGTMIHAGPLRDGLDEPIREACGEQAGGVFSVSQRRDVIVCRYLGGQAEEGKALFLRAWDTLRTATQGKPASPPRIWAT